MQRHMVLVACNDPSGEPAFFRTEIPLSPAGGGAYRRIVSPTERAEAQHYQGPFVEFYEDSFTRIINAAEAASRMSSHSGHLVLVACWDTRHQAEFFHARVSADPIEYADRRHHEIARRQATTKGYRGPFLVFDESHFEAIIHAADLVACDLLSRAMSR